MPRRTGCAVILSKALLVTVAVQLSCQAWKVLYYSLALRRFEWRRFTSAGGMPSAHSAFVAALVVSVGIQDGLQSSAFTVAAVLAAIVVFDAIRLRGAVDRLSALVTRLLPLLPADQRPAPPGRVGHSFAEVVVGLLVGGGLAAAALYLLPGAGG